jgi:rare lipoprotein A
VGRLEPARRAAGHFIALRLAMPVRLALVLCLIGSLTGWIAACGSGGGSGLGERIIPFGQPVPKGGGYYTVGKPYQIAGAWYHPRENPTYNRVGRASWYGELFHGRRTANGEIYDMDRLSAAHPTLPLPIYARVTNLKNGRSVVVRVNDRGPYARDRIIDLSRRSAEVLGFRRTGTTVVRVEYLGRAPLNGDDSYERQYLASRSWMQVASSSTAKSKGEASIVSLAEEEALPAENPENLVARRKVVGPPPVQTASIVPSEAVEQASLKPGKRRTAGLDDPHLPTGRMPLRQGSVLIQAGSFKSKENATKARAALGPIAPVDIAEIDVGGDVYYRVRIGPFSDKTAAEAALSRVARVGYQGAKIVAND